MRRLIANLIWLRLVALGCAWLRLVALGRKFRDATEGVVGKSLNVPDWPTGDLEQLLRRSLVSDVEIEQGLHARLLG
jgi:hypothetical protein